MLHVCAGSEQGLWRSLPSHPPTSPTLPTCACVVDAKADSPGLHLLPPLCSNVLASVFTLGKWQLMSQERRKVECSEDHQAQSFAWLSLFPG